MFKSGKRILAGVLSLICMSATIFTGSISSSAANTEKDIPLYWGNTSSYSEYIKNYENLNYGQTKKLTPKEAFGELTYIENVNGTGKDGVSITDTGSAAWKFIVPADCMYVINVEYMSGKAGSGNFELGFKVDDKIPFDETSLVSFARKFSQKEEKFNVNGSGNDILPDIIESAEWETHQITDMSGYVDTPFRFYFSPGEHTIKFEGSRGNIIIGGVSLTEYNSPLSYKEYSSNCSSKGYTSPGKAKDITVQGENPSSQSAVTIIPKTDRNSPATEPQSATNLKLNIIGGTGWKNIGESLTWDIEVEKSGMYEIALRSKQDLVDGIFTTRKLYIDGFEPFKEAGSLRFYYNTSWQYKKLGNEKETYQFYLEAGKHTITLEAVIGDAAEMISAVEASLNELNSIYRRIVMITGASPDPYRDYNFKKIIPDEIKQLGEIGTKLGKSVEYIDSQAGATGSYTSIIKKLVFQLEKIHENPKTIAKTLEQFKTNLGSLSSWLLTAREQPLKLDYITIVPAQKEIDTADSRFFKNCLFSVKCFLSSYVTDYAVIGGGDSEGSALKVWIQSGRDQGEIIRQLIDSSYALKSKNKVQLEIVAAGTLLQSVLSGQAPDLVFDNASSEPVDYALRGAVADFKQFEDYDTVKNWFYDAAISPATFNDGVYGIPQTFDFYMLFYRTDIFENYGYSLPKTWKDLIKLIPAMQRNSFDVGLPHDVNAYAMFLYQNGGKLYRDNGAKTNLDSNLAIETFVDFTEFFTLYDLPVTFDFANRFRTGEMPLGIQSYTLYNQLTAFAPEIKGLWKMVPIPGTEDANRNINNVSIGSASYIMMMESSKNKKAAWEFVKWFMSTEIQSSYAIRMESVLGTCAKVATANTEALKQMTWSSSEYQNILSQADNVDAVPQVPGGYYLPRIITFAFNRVYNSSTTQNMGEEPSEVIGEYISEINDEIKRKRDEFGVK